MLRDGMTLSEWLDADLRKRMYARDLIATELTESLMAAEKKILEMDARLETMAGKLAECDDHMRGPLHPLQSPVVSTQSAVALAAPVPPKPPPNTGPSLREN